MALWARMIISTAISGWLWSRHKDNSRALLDYTKFLTGVKKHIFLAGETAPSGLGRFCVTCSADVTCNSAAASSRIFSKQPWGSCRDMQTSAIVAWASCRVTVGEAFGAAAAVAAGLMRLTTPLQALFELERQQSTRSSSQQRSAVAKVKLLPAPQR